MSNLLVRNVPEEVHERLRARALASGRSLQQYLLEELQKLVERPSLDEVLDRAASTATGQVGFESAVRSLESERR